MSHESCSREEQRHRPCKYGTSTRAVWFIAKKQKERAKAAARLVSQLEHAVVDFVFLCVRRCLLQTRYRPQTSPLTCPPPGRSPPSPVTTQRRTGCTHRSRCSGTPCCGKGWSKLLGLLIDQDGQCVDLRLFYKIKTLCGPLTLHLNLSGGLKIIAPLLEREISAW